MTDDEVIELFQEVIKDLRDWKGLLGALDQEGVRKLLTMYPPEEVLRKKLQEYLGVNEDNFVLPENKQEILESGGDNEDDDAKVENKQWDEINLDDVKGLGEKTIENIKNAFNSPEDILTAGIQELQKVDGVGKSTAENVINKLNSYYNNLNDEEGNTEDENITDEQINFASDDGFYNEDAETEHEEDDEGTERVDERKHNPDLHETMNNSGELDEEELEEIQNFT